ncbi:hypothetical protein JTB14_012596 [Gonioctena quinquepunctata]|nr:hypothetical protein JTB14_012596 [Gonioctena quinquepunctata]
MYVSFTDEQFQQLLNRLSIETHMTVESSVDPATVESSGNFSKGSSRFDGSRDSDVNVFIDVVEIFKDCTKVSDDKPWKEIPMLLEGFATS